jgi:nucleoside-diphosphate-sugar epimerase
VAKALAASGERVTALVRQAGRPLPGGIDVVIGDIADASSVDRAFTVHPVDTVIHIAAAVPGVPDAAQAFSRSVAGTRLLAQAARRCGVRRFVHVSSAGVYGAGVILAPTREDAPLLASSPYERSKLEAEQALRAELTGGETQWVVLRPAGIYGPGRPQTLDFLRQVLRKPIWLHGPSRLVLHPTHVDDVVASIMAVRRRDDLSGEAFNVGGERPIVFQELIALVASLLPCRVYQISLPAMRTVDRSLDTTKARTRLRLEPRPLADGMADCIAACRAQGSL